MTSIERTAYPQFKRLTSARVLTPTEDEAGWARERTETPESLLALLVDLKCFQRMARFCPREEIPDAVADHVRHCLGLAPETGPDHGADRTMRLHRALVRQWQGATRDMRQARGLAEAAIREAAQVRRYYLKQDARQAALTFVDALEDAYVILGQHPVIGAASYATELDIPELRSWALPRFSYVIFYVERKDHIDGWPVLHGRRDIPALVEDPDPE